MNKNNDLLDFIQEITIPELEMILRKTKGKFVDKNTEKGFGDFMKIIIAELEGFIPEKYEGQKMKVRKCIKKTIVREGANERY